MDHLCYLCLVLLCFQARLYVDAFWSPAGKGLTSWLSFVMSGCVVVTFSIGILGQVWCLIVSIPDLCPLSYFAGRTYHIVGNLMSQLILYKYSQFYAQSRDMCFCCFYSRKNNSKSLVVHKPKVFSFLSCL